MEVKVVPTRLRKCKNHYTSVCMDDIKDLGGNAALLWVILCNKWDLAKHKAQSNEERKGWVTVTRKTASEYGLGKGAFKAALAKLESANMVYVLRQGTSAARIKMKGNRAEKVDEPTLETIPKSADVLETDCPEIRHGLSRNPPSCVPESADGPFIG